MSLVTLRGLTRFLRWERAGTSSGAYIDGLTGLRALAAFWVLLHHAWNIAGPRRIALPLGDAEINFTPFFGGGWFGVDIFYVLSGFLLTLPFCQAARGLRVPVAWGDYFRRRLFRVLPAYYVQLAIFITLAWLGLSGALPSLGNTLAHLLMVHNWWFDYNGSLNGVYWTLPVEFAFYLVLPLLVRPLVNDRWLYLAVAAVTITISYRYLGFRHIADASIPIKVWVLEQLPGRLDQFVFGMIAGYFFVKVQPRLSGRFETVRPRHLGEFAFAIAVLGLAGTLFVQFSGDFRAYWQGDWRLFVFHGVAGLFLAIGVFGLAMNSRLGRALFANRVMVFLGAISYSLYLWHVPVMTWIAGTNWFQGYTGYKFLPLLLVSVPAVILVSAMSYLLVERPFLKLRHGVKSKPQVQEQPAGAG
jgi:peptidoglycan/LPS O-acetylase OafA/YrhL